MLLNKPLHGGGAGEGLRGSGALHGGGAGEGLRVSGVQFRKLSLWIDPHLRECSVTGCNV